MDELLSSARVDGQFDSEGSFTIASEAARGKLAAFQLPRPSAWVLKILQGAQLLGCSRMSISQATTITTFALRLSEPPDLDMLHASLLSLELNPKTGLDHLAVGLRAVGFGDSRWFRVTLDEGNDQYVLSWDGKEVCRTHTPGWWKFQHSRFRIEVDFPKNDPRVYFMGQSRMKGRAADEYLEVTRRGYTCAYPIFYDGRLISGLASVGSSHSSLKTVNLGLTWCPSESTEQSLSMPDEICRNLSSPRIPFFRKETEFIHVWGDNNTRELGAFFTLKYSRERAKQETIYQDIPIPQSSALVWVRDGVICERWTVKDIKHPMSFELHLSANNLPTDISGLSLKDGPERQERVSEGVRYLKDSLPALELEINTVSRRGKFIGGAIGLLAAAAFPFVMGLSVPVIIGSTMVVLSGEPKEKSASEYTDAVNALLPLLENLEFLPTDTLGEG